MKVDFKERRMSIMKIMLVVQKSIIDVNPDGKGRINRNRATPLVVVSSKWIS